MALAAVSIPITSNAVYVSPDGLGQALIFPYYTTRPTDGNAFNTYISIVNHTQDAKVMRVRFREGRNGREVANFNLFLGSGDAWTAALAAPPANNLPTRLLSADRSCMLPALSTQTGSLPFLDFSSASYDGANTDGYGTGGDRTREGYVEVIEMATLQGATADAVRIGANGQPANCGTLDGALGLGAPTGGLSGSLTLINVQSGLDFTANAEALAQLTTIPFYRAAADPYPDFTSSEVLPSSLFIAGDNKAYRIAWGSGADAVTGALLRETISNEVILDTATLSSTDWVVTFPTKRLYGTTPGSSGPFAPSLDTDRHSIPFQMKFQPRDGQQTSYVVSCGFLCPPQNVEIPMSLPWAASVVGFRLSGTTSSSGAAGTSGALGSTNAWILSLPQTAQAGGAATLSFDGVHTTPTTASASARTFDAATGDTTSTNVRVRGMPAVGFAVRTFRNGTLTCAGSTSCQGNYGGMFVHQGVRTVTP
ncbi:hypothetical protein BWI17_10640 [Betaproteobacteria bacterium GR16-43]|nr:hypothetical protein BWI17_10640 [Betaproteobacteria bacterium GR16-43]